jgi:hypothetical protein
MGIALVLARLTGAWALAVAGVAFAYVVAIAPVRVRAMTRLRTMIFMVYNSPLGYS